MMEEAELIRRLSGLHIYRDFEQSFSQVTGLSVRLRESGQRNLASADGCQDDEFPSIILVPVLLGGRTIGVLQTGPVASEGYRGKGFPNRKRQVLKTVTERKPNGVSEESAPVFSQSRREAVLHLLQIFAEQLSLYANQIVIKANEGEPYHVRVARAFIVDHRMDDINLADVARATHVSTFYLCKIFKKATGLTFVEYRNRLRIESAKKMLLNPNLTVSEVAYTVGFQSLTQFNRLFRRIVGSSPTRFRSQLGPEVTPTQPERILIGV